MIYLGEHVVGLNAPFESEDKPVIQSVYVRPSSWPNLEEILAAHPASEKGYGYAYAMLVEGRNSKSAYNYITVPVNSAGCRHYVTSWGLDEDAKSSTQKWVLSNPEIYQEFEWIVVYTDSANDVVTWGPSYYPYTFRWLLWFYAPGAKITSTGYATGFCGIKSMREFTAEEVIAHSYFFQFGMMLPCKVDVKKYTIADSGATRSNGSSFPQTLDTVFGIDLQLSVAHDIHDIFNGQYYVKDIGKISFLSGAQDITTTYSMFAYCYSLEHVDVSEFNMSAVTNCNNMFFRCRHLKTLNSSTWDMRSVRTVRDMFTDCRSLTSIQTENWSMPSLSDAYDMFVNCNLLASISMPNTGMQNVKNFQSMFYACYSLEYAELPNWAPSSATIMRNMFYDCTLMKYANLSGWTFGDSLSDASNMFAYCTSLSSINVEGWNFKCTNTVEQMFNGCNSLISLDVSSWDMSQVKNMRLMFENCKSLISIDVSNWDTSNVSSMQEMFYYCNNLTSIDVSNWNTSNVTTMQNMFNNAYQLRSIDISQWDMSKVTNAQNMFYNNYALESVKIGDCTHVFASQFGYCLSCMLFDFRACTQVPALDNTNAFYQIPSNAKIVVPDSLYSTWRTSTNWSNSAIQPKIISATDYENSLLT